MRQLRRAVSREARRFVSKGVDMKVETRNRYECSRSALKIIALLLLGGLLSGCEQKLPTQTPSVSPASAAPRNGRYMIVFSPIVRADTFLLDTQKGRVWQLTKNSDLVGEPTVWDDMIIIDGSGEIPGSITTLEFLKAFSKKSENKKK